MSEHDGEQAAVAATTTGDDNSPSTQTTTDDDATRFSMESDRDTETDHETFEDAPDTTATTPPRDTSSVRSLTQRPSSSTKQSQPIEDSASELAAAFKKVRGRAAIAASDLSPTERDSPNDQGKEEKAQEKPELETTEKEELSERRGSSTTTASITINGVTTADDHDGELDNVNLDDEPPARSAVPPRFERPLPPSPPPSTSAAISVISQEAPPVKDKPKESRTLSLGSITGVLPSMPWSPNPEAPTRKSSPPQATLPAPPPPSRKLTSPFSWLSRNSTPKDPASTSPPTISPRRNTTSSVATLVSNPEMMLSKLDEEQEDKMNDTNGNVRNSLKDRFKMIRMREEAGGIVPGEEDKSASSGEKIVGLGLTEAGAAGEDKDNLAVQAPLSPLPQSPNPSLAPGTASGVNAGPSAIDSAPVDWDLWQNVIYEGPAAVARTSTEELSKAIATGIPSAIRGVIWQVLAQSKNDELEAVYKELVARGTDKDKDRLSNSSVTAISAQKEPGSSASSTHSESAAAAGASSTSDKDSEATQKAQAAERKKKTKEDAVALQKLEKVIKRDLGARTSYSKYAAAQGLQEGLFGICKAYALFDESVGYAQGMNFLIMPILFNMPEEEAFCLLVKLMNQYKLRDLFTQDMPGLHKHLYQFERLLEDLEPALYCHLHRKGISPHLYATQWFLTLFAYRFPLQLVLRIYDLILSEGLSAILRFGIVLMQKNAAALLAMSDMAQLTTYLKDRLFDVYIDAAPSAGSILENGFFGSSSASLDKEVYRADQFVRDACEVKLTPEILKLYTAEWEDKTKTEKDRETELETLRYNNSSLTHKVRKLEERIEAADHEQADIATEMVHTQVRNEELKDENESLKGQVRELRKVIENQPEELEQTWKAERDDLMKRNVKVHEENQRLEKELVDLEEQLVQTKLKYAEINSQHETLTRKWTDLKRQFDA